MNSRRKLATFLAGAVGAAFLGSLLLTWLLHDSLAERNANRLIDIAFEDVENAIREAVDRRLVRQAMLFRDRLPALRAEPVWADPQAAVARLREVARELFVDELCVVGADGILTHSADARDIGFDFNTIGGQAGAFRPLLDRETEVAQSLMPNSRAGDMIKYVGVWLPEGGFVQVGCREASVRHLARSAVTGLTHNRHVSGNDGYMVITTAGGTIISHLDPAFESGQWRGAPPDCHWQRREVEGFPVYAMVPKHAAVVERRVLVGTSALLNAAALVLASVLVGIVIAVWVRSQARARRAKELAMAADIQENAIPRVFPPFPSEKRIDLFADMRPARDVGGDFYDFYFTGPQAVTFLVADVSDKGVPAALFMMRAKTILKNLAQSGRPLADVVREANDALCEGNAANMFVTAWIGTVDLATGVVTYVNAGHNPPLRLRAKDGSAAYVRSRPGLVLGAMPGAKYRAETLSLEPGDAIYLYTDGVTEQSDPHGELFGEERLRSFLEGGGFLAHPETCTGAVLAGVDAHAAGAEQSDDRTQLLVIWRGA
ncbi:MAG: serine/threonine-protein phosphatase [Kiritimatiellae bacterium]|nr:serine/threonine-protein phosphatase [Kiritimatiellia bacterium]